MDHVAAVRARIADIQGRFGIPEAPAPPAAPAAPFAQVLQRAVPLDASPLQPFDAPSAPGPEGSADVPDAAPYEGLIASSATRHGVDPGLLRAVVRAESGYNPKAVSRCGAQGLMQLMPDTSRALGVSDPFDPAQNIDGGARYLRHLLDRFGEPDLAVAAYNAGPGSVKRYDGVPPFAETQGYVRRVMDLWDEARSNG